MTKPIDHLIQKEMSRKEFLATMGFGLASIMGFSTIIHLFTGKSLTHHGVTATRAGFGSGAYGGGKD
jgi:hypothetical protein